MYGENLKLNFKIIFSRKRYIKIPTCFDPSWFIFGKFFTSKLTLNIAELNKTLWFVHKMCIYYKVLCKNTGLFKMIVGVLTTCHTQYTWDSSIRIFLFNMTTLQVFVTYLTSALYVHHLWFYKHQYENRVRSKLFVACQRFAFRRRLSNLRSKRRNA